MVDWCKNVPVAFVKLKERESEGAFFSPENLPLLKTIDDSSSETKLVVRSFRRNLGGVVDIRMLRRLAEDVRDTVDELNISNLGASSMIELQETFSLFDNKSGGPPLKKLSLSTLFPLVHAMSAATCLRDIISLNICLKKEMVPEWTHRYDSDENQPFVVSSVGLHLSALASLPKVQELSITLSKTNHRITIDNDAVVSFMLGCSAIPGLKRLWSTMLYDWHDDCGKTVATMLHRLPDLEELGLLSVGIRGYVWQHIHAMGGHRKLRKLALSYTSSVMRTHQHDVDALVRACSQDFPSLVELEIHFKILLTPGEVIRALEGLKSHPSLSVIKFGCFIGENGNFFLECRQSLGARISVMEIKYVDHTS